MSWKKKAKKLHQHLKNNPGSTRFGAQKLKQFVREHFLGRKQFIENSWEWFFWINLSQI